MGGVPTTQRARDGYRRITVTPLAGSLGDEIGGVDLAREVPKAMFVNVAHTARFDGMNDDESRPLLQYLFQHQVRPEFTVRFRWEIGSIALWDNRCAQHNPVKDYHGHRRVMHRITL